MRFLADENCDFNVVGALRAAGHDVLAVAEASPRAEDSDVIRLAVNGERILLTEDKDFGQLVFAEGKGVEGVVLPRFPFPARERIARDVVQLVGQEGARLSGCFVVVDGKPVFGGKDAAGHSLGPVHVTLERLAAGGRR